jgi:hypothetical protein
MTPKLLRLAYVFEFLVALVAIFSAWSEIGGQAALDAMYWGWKLGLGFGLAAAVVAYTVALVSEDSWWSLRSARWLATMLLLTVVMGAVTYFYALQVDSGDSDDNGNMSLLHSPQRLLTPGS